MEILLNAAGRLASGETRNPSAFGLIAAVCLGSLILAVPFGIVVTTFGNNNVR